MQIKHIRWMTSIALGLALFVVMLGAYTRLTDAGLGCPDWPGCYGKMVLPNATDSTRVAAQAAFPDIPIESRKAWTEMAHRYAAGTLGILILLMIAATSFGPRAVRVSPLFSVALAGILFFQAALGMWTVTLQLLPVVVMGHLLGGMTIAALLAWFRWRMSGVYRNDLSVQPWVVLGLFIVGLQIALGGWVSSNYAGLACIGFPMCNQHWLPILDWSSAFNIFSPVGANYQGGALDLPARVTIQWVHRVWALVTMLYILGLTSYLVRFAKSSSLRYMASFAMVLVVLQCALGVFNVIYMLPLAVAVAHNGVALLLLMCMVSLVYLVSGRRV